MASITKSKPTPKASSLFDDDDKWTDIIADKDEKDTPPPPQPASPPIATSPLNVPFGILSPPMAALPAINPQQPIWGNTNPMQIPPRRPYPALPGDTSIPFPSQQMVLEAQLMQLAEVDLGLLNAADILEKHLLDKKLVQGSYEIFLNTNINSPLRVVQSPANRFHIYSAERQNMATVVRDMAYLMGLDCAVKLLRDAHQDRSRTKAKFSARVIPLNLPPAFPPSPPFVLPPPMPPPMSINESQFRNVAREIVKDTLKECKGDNFSQSLEEVQKEMIKLCRDVCRDALAKKE